MAIAPRDTTGFGRSDLHIPSVINPPGRRCITLSIPDDPEHVRLIAGILHPLTKPYNWTDGTEEEKDEISSVYAQMYLDIDWLGECMPTPIVNMRVTDCGIEVQYGLDPTWIPVTDGEFVPLAGQCAMTGGLEIYSVINEPSLRIQPNASNPGNPLSIEVINKDNRRIIETGGAGGYFRVYDSTTVANYLQFNHQAAGDAVINSVGAGRLFIGAPRTIGLNASTSFGVGIQSATNILGAALSVLNMLATQIGLIVKQHASQTADMTQWVDSANTRLAAIKVAGSALFTKLTLQQLTSIAYRDAAAFEATWDVATDASRVGRFTLNAEAYNGSREIIRGRNDGTQAQIGFLGATPQPALAISGDHRQNVITQQIVELLALFGLCIDNTTNNTFNVINGERQGYPLMATLIEQLELYSNGAIVDNTSEGDCLLVCEVPPPETYCKIYDFSDPDVRAPWTVERGVEGTTGFESTLADEVVFIHVNQFDVFHIIEVMIEYSLSGSSDGSIILGAYDYTGYTSQTWSNVPAGTGQQVTVDFAPSYDAFTGFRLVAISNDTAQQIIITGLKVLAYDQGSWGEIPMGADCP